MFELTVDVISRDPSFKEGKSAAEFKEFDPRLKFETRLK